MYLLSSTMLDSSFLLGSVNPHVESVVLKVLIQLIVVIVAARLLAVVARWLGQPVVVGEIIGGLALGPSFFGKYFKAQFDLVFDPSIKPIFDVLSQLALILLLFLIGLEFDFSHLRMKGRAAWSISFAGIILPFSIGYGLGHWLHPNLAPETNLVGFCLFMGTAMSITAIPILGRIMIELNLSRTMLGAITITAAAFDDATGWIILATVSALVTTGFNWILTMRMIAWTAAFALAMIYVVRPVLVRFYGWVLAGSGGQLGLNPFAGLLVVMFLCAIATNLIGIFSIFGAFICGAILSDQGALREWVQRNLTPFVTVFFLPIFFTFTGLRTDVGSLATLEHWLYALLVLAAAVIGKFGGCFLAARFSGMDWRESCCVGIMMNTRALMELIVINVGYELGVVPRSLFVMLVIMAVITTIITTPALVFFCRGTELGRLIEQSNFAKGRAPLPGISRLRAAWSTHGG